MKLPRWLVVLLINLSVFAPVAAAGFWWISWPARSIRQFMELMADGKIEETNRMIKPPQKWATNPGDMLGLQSLDTPEFLSGNRGRSVWRQRFESADGPITLAPRSFTDILASRGSTTQWWPESAQVTGGVLQGSWWREKLSVPATGLYQLQEGYELIAERGQITVRYNSRLLQ